MKPSISNFLKLAAAYVMLLATTALCAQENAEEKLLQVKANELVLYNPDESIKIANHLLKKPQSQENITALNLLISRGYTTKGDYNRSLDYVYEAGKIAKGTNDSLNAEVLLLKAELSRKLHLFKQSGDYLIVAEQTVKAEKAADIQFFTTRIQLEKALIKLDGLRFKEALAALQKIKTNNSYLQIRVAYSKAMALLGLADYKSSEFEFTKAQKKYRSLSKPNTVFEVGAAIGLSKIYYSRKEYQRALVTLFQISTIALALNNIPLQEEIYYQVAANYLALGVMTDYQVNYDKFLALNTQSMNLENEGVNSVFNLVNEEQESDYTAEITTLKIYTYSALAFFVLIVIGGVLLYINNKNQRRRLKEIVGYLEVTNNLLVKSYTIDKKEPVKKIAISNETEQTILAKLKRFEASTKYTSNDMSLATLSAQLDVNTKYLSEIINKHYNDNFNMYINRLRINYIIEKLKNEPEYLNYKISYLADESGFSSHSSFATVFKSITGIAPTVFIDLIGKEVNHKKA